MKYLLISILLLSCSTSEEEQFRRRNIGEYFTGSGVVQYFLPDLPSWANTVGSVSCRRQNNIRFFNFEKLQSSFGFSYEQLIQFQMAFNISRLENDSGNIMSLTQEERLFYSVSERVQAGIVPFNLPKYKSINLVVIDSYADASNDEPLKKLLQSQKFLSGYPIFVSLCYNDKNIRRYIEKLDFKGKFEVLPLSAFSPYSAEFVLQTSPALYLVDFFGKEKNITVFTPKGQAVPDLMGEKTKQNY